MGAVPVAIQEHKVTHRAVFVEAKVRRQCDVSSDSNVVACCAFDGIITRDRRGYDTVIAVRYVIEEVVTVNVRMGLFDRVSQRGEVSRTGAAVKSNLHVAQVFITSVHIRACITVDVGLVTNGTAGRKTEVGVQISIAIDRYRMTTVTFQRLAQVRIRHPNTVSTSGNKFVEIVAVSIRCSGEHRGGCVP